MNKRIFIFLAAVALAATLAVPAFADTAADAKTWFEQRFNARQEAVNQAVENGSISYKRGTKEVWPVPPLFGESYEIAQRIVDDYSAIFLDSV